MLDTVKGIALPGYDDIGQRMYELIEELYPLCRSISGEGVRDTLSIVQRYVPLVIHEVPSGTEVFDWQVPREWNIKDAYIKNQSGEIIVDFRQNNLHVKSYSVPVKKKMNIQELKKHLHTLPDHPDWIPYRTSYYNESWGFCVSYNQLQQMDDEEYEVCIDSTLEEGSLTYGEFSIEGQVSETILFFCHTCHPSLCNDNLSGIALLTYLARYLSMQTLRYSYRFVFAPATIGSITWLSRNEADLHRVKHGLVASVLGDPGGMTYKRSRHGSAEIDRAVEHVLKTSGKEFQILEFTPYGYDERQFCSPGINLPVGRLTRSPNGCYPEYHTSADNLELVKPEFLGESFSTYMEIVALLENNLVYLNESPKCEPQLGRRGLYRKTGGHQDIGQPEFAMLWVLNLSDGQHSLLDIAERSGLRFSIIHRAAMDLLDCGLLKLA